MKKYLLILVLVLFMGCAPSTTGVYNIHSEKIVNPKDARYLRVVNKCNWKAGSFCEGEISCKNDWYERCMEGYGYKEF
ncbi:MAG: hypothetical protein HQ552_14840 [Desulfobacteraceae bacterium]|nr:hypothetical protein [Desulfobacteraceae bacterium]